MWQNRKKIIKHFSVFALIVYTLIFPYEITYHMKYALRLCATAVVPSLFMFMVLSKMLCSFSKYSFLPKRLTGFLCRFFGLSESLIPICLIGLISGSPSGAFGINDIYSKGLCTKDEAERAIILSNNCSAAFILTIGASVVESTMTALIILISNITATIFVYTVFFKQSIPKSIKQKTQDDDKSFSDIITACVSQSAYSAIELCSFVLFFYTLSSVICQRTESLMKMLGFSQDITDIFKTFICSVFEISCGVLSSANLSQNLKTMAVCSAIAFCSISIIFQVKSLAGKQGLSVKRFVLSKIICAFTSPIITLFLLLVLPREVLVMNTYALNMSAGITIGDLISLTFITFVAIAGMLLLSYLDKKHKN